MSDAASNLNLLLEAITPEIFAADFATPGSVESKMGIVSCSFIGTERFRIYAGGFVAEDIGLSTFKAGTVLDVLAAIYGNKKEDAWFFAVRILCDKYKSLLPSIFSQENVARDIALYARRKRLLFNKVACSPITHPDLSGTSIVRCCAVLKENAFPPTARVVDSNFIKELIPLLGFDPEGLGELRKIRSAIMLPYYSSVGEIGALEFLRTDRKHADPLVLEVAPCGHATAGLLDVPPNAISLLVANPSELLEMRHRIRVLTFSHTTCRSYLPGCVAWIANKDLDALVEVARIASSGVIVTPIDGLGQLYSHTWQQLAVGAIVELIEQHRKVTSETKVLLASLRGDEEAINALRQIITDKGHTQLTDAINRELRIGIIANTDAGLITSTESGYAIEHKRTSGRSQITNFTINLKNCIVFENGEHYYKIDVRLGGVNTKDILIRSSALDNARTLSLSLQQAMGLRPDNTPFMPAIMDMTSMRFVLVNLMHIASSLPVTPGISLLGWNANCTRFSAPAFTVTKDGIVDMPAVFKPGVDYLKNFEGGEYKYAPHANLPEELKDVVGIACLIIVAAFMGKSGIRVFYNTDSDTAATLSTIFSYIGQTHVVSLNRNVRNNGELTCFCGFPFVGTGYDREMAERSKASAVLLYTGEKAIKATKEDTHAAGRLLNYAVRVLTVRLTSKAVQSLIVPDMQNDDDIIEAGRTILDSLLEPAQEDDKM